MKTYTPKPSSEYRNGVELHYQGDLDRDSSDKMVDQGVRLPSEVDSAIEAALVTLPWEEVTEGMEWDEDAEYLCASKNGSVAGSWFYYQVYFAEGKWWEDEDGILFTALNKHYAHRIRITLPEGD